MVFPPQPSDGLFLVIWRCLEAHSANFVVIQTHLSHRLFLTVSFLVLRWSGSWSQIINQAQDCREQPPRNRDLGQLEGNIAAMAGNLGADFH